MALVAWILELCSSSKQAQVMLVNLSGDGGAMVAEACCFLCYSASWSSVEACSCLLTLDSNWMVMRPWQKQVGAQKGNLCKGTGKMLLNENGFPKS